MLSERRVVIFHDELKPTLADIFYEQVPPGFTLVTIDLMKRTSILINTARGPAVNIQDLADALREGRIRGAGIDVHDPEPITPEYPLLNCPNIVLTPHSAAGTRDTQYRVVKAAFENVMRVESGQEPLDRVT